MSWVWCLGSGVLGLVSVYACSLCLFSMFVVYFSISVYLQVQVAGSCSVIEVK